MVENQPQSSLEPHEARMTPIASLTHEQDPRVATLRQALDEFYAKPSSYSDFEVAVNHKPEYWCHVLDAVRERAATLPEGEPVRVLEFGAGRTGFASFLGPLRSRVHFTTQDVTHANEDHLRSQADTVHIGDVAALAGPFDVIFSTFVWEHITNPAATYAHLLGVLRPGGCLIIACPRYDVPLYIPPSARHYSRLGQLRVAAWLVRRRLAAIAGGPARFWIHTDPAVLRVADWFRDSDAIHWVSRADFTKAAPPEYRVRRLRARIAGLKGMIFNHLLLAFVRNDRPAGLLD